MIFQNFNNLKKKVFLELSLTMSVPYTMAFFNVADPFKAKTSFLSTTLHLSFTSLNLTHSYKIFKLNRYQSRHSIHSLYCEQLQITGHKWNEWGSSTFNIFSVASKKALGFCFVSVTFPHHHQHTNYLLWLLKSARLIFWMPGMSYQCIQFILSTI